MVNSKNGIIESVENTHIGFIKFTQTFTTDNYQATVNGWSKMEGNSLEVNTLHSSRGEFC